MAVVIGADFQMFVLWKDTRVPFNLSHLTWERMLKSRDHRWPLKDGKHISVDHLFSLEDGIYTLLFVHRSKKFKGWIVLH